MAVDWKSDGIARSFGGPSDYDFSIAASADGSRIAAGGADGALFIWNGQNGQVIRKIKPLPARLGPPRPRRAAEPLTGERASCRAVLYRAIPALEPQKLKAQGWKIKVKDDGNQA